jgi:hypothetical protein
MSRLPDLLYGTAANGVNFAPTSPLFLGSQARCFGSSISSRKLPAIGSVRIDSQF